MNFSHSFIFSNIDDLISVIISQSAPKTGIHPEWYASPLQGNMNTQHHVNSQLEAIFHMAIPNISMI